MPILACDFLPTGFDHGLYEPVVSETVLYEVEPTLRNDFPKLDGAAITYRVDAIRDVLADHLIEPELADPPTTVNVKDQYVVAAAIVGEASVVVTNDRRLGSRSRQASPVFSHSPWTSSRTSSPKVTRKQSHH